MPLVQRLRSTSAKDAESRRRSPFEEIERARLCKRQYGELAYAFQQLIVPHFTGNLPNKSWIRVAPRRRYAGAPAATAGRRLSNMVTASSRPAALASNRVDGREGGKPAQDTYCLFSCDPTDGANRLLGVVCGVWGDNHVVKLQERVGRAPVSLLGRFFLNVVERRASDPSFGERLVDCRVVHDRATRRIDEDGGRLHPPQRLPIEQVAGLARERCLDDQIVCGFDKFIEGNGPHISPLHLGRIEEWVIGPDIDAKCPYAFRNAACDCAEGYQAENAPAEPPNRLPSLPAPFASPDGSIVLADLADGGEPERYGMVGNLLGAPVVRGIRDLYATTCGGVDVDDIHAGAVAGNHTAARECIDGARANWRILGQDAIGFASVLDDLVFTLALRRDKLETRPLGDSALDPHVAEIVVCDQDRALGLCTRICLHGCFLCSPRRRPASVAVEIAAKTPCLSLWQHTPTSGGHMRYPVRAGRVLFERNQPLRPGVQHGSDDAPGLLGLVGPDRQSEFTRENVEKQLTVGRQLSRLKLGGEAERHKRAGPRACTG